MGSPGSRAEQREEFNPDAAATKAPADVTIHRELLSGLQRRPQLRLGAWVFILSLI